MKPKTGVYWVWSMLYGRDLLKNKGRWSSEDGSKVSILDDNWLLHGKKL